MTQTSRAFAAPDIGFREANARFHRYWATFRGRATRGEFWWGFLGQFLILLCLAMLMSIVLLVSGTDLEAGESPAMAFWVLLGLFGVYWFWSAIPMWAAMTRRLHDTGRSGWWVWIALIPLLGAIWLIVLLATPGVAGSTRYDDPAVGYASA